MTAHNRISEFAQRHLLSPDEINISNVLEDFLAEMGAGLAGSGSLAMIPSYIGPGSGIEPGRSVAAIDAGGTNLRAALVDFHENGTPRVHGLTKGLMPGIKTEVSADEFFGRIAELVAPLAKEADSIGFCFSYPAEITPDRDGKLVRWTKEIKAPEVIGLSVGAGLREALSAMGVRRPVTVLNDTIAALMACTGPSDKQYGGYAGFILGTGTNTAYVERNANIAKTSGLDLEQAQAINMESGNFALAPRGDIDLALDSATEAPGRNSYEKMISGAYLGTLSLLALKAAAREGLISRSAADAIEGVTRMESAQVSGFLQTGELTLGNAEIEGEDRTFILGIMSNVVQRAAILASVCVAGAVIKSGEGAERSPPVKVNVDGSTLYKMHGMRKAFETSVEALLSARGRSWERVKIENSPLIGAAASALACA